MALGGANHLRTPLLFGESQAAAIGTGILMIVGGIAAVYAGARMSRFGRRHTTRLLKGPRLLAPRSYILYLRPFDLDDQLYGIKPAPSRNPVRGLRTPLSRTFEEDLVLSLRLKVPFTARAAEFDGREAAGLAGFRWPDYPALKHPDTRISVVGTQGFLFFGPGWEPEFVRLDPTAVRALSDLGRLRKVMRQQVNPALRRVKHRLSGAPDAAT